MTRGVQIRLEPEKPTNLPDIDLISARTEAPISQWWVSDSKNQWQQVKWRVCFSKTRATRTRLSYKKIEKNMIESSYIQRDLNQIWLDLARFGQILAIFNEICRIRWKKCRIRPKKCKIRWHFVDFGNILQILTTFLQIPTTFFQILTIDQTDWHSPSPETD